PMPVTAHLSVMLIFRSSDEFVRFCAHYLACCPPSPANMNSERWTFGHDGVYKDAVVLGATIKGRLLAMQHLKQYYRITALPVCCTGGGCPGIACTPPFCA
ncbi:MAG: hypothetical protein VCB63_14980, partial [Alphaproteobacteria bacterium]